MARSRGFKSDSFAGVCSLEMFNLIDVLNCEGPAITIKLSMQSPRVVMLVREIDRMMGQT